MLIHTASIGSKGRSAVFIAKGPSKKRKWAEYEAVNKEFKELKEDKWNFLAKVKRIRTDHEVLNNVMVQIRDQNPDMQQVLSSMFEEQDALVAASA
jgi:hypothetical protein